MVVDDFEFAAKRFSKQQQQRGTSRTGLSRGTGTTNTGRRMNTTASSSSLSSQQNNAIVSNNNNNKKVIALSEKARNEAIENKKQQTLQFQNKQQLKHILQKQYEFFYDYYESHLLGIRNLQSPSIEHNRSYIDSSNNGSNWHTIGTTPEPKHLQLQPTSIYGDGDKITLPMSVLDVLTSRSEFESVMERGSVAPWYFRIAIPNPNYTTTSFPASPLLQDYFSKKYNKKKNNNTNVDTTTNNNMELDDYDDNNTDDDDDSDTDSDSDDNDENKTKLLRDLYLDELKYKYLSYTHGTVIEFTQEEGYIGLTKPICDALLLPNRNSTSTIPNTIIPVSRTIDPSTKISQNDNNKDSISNDDVTMKDDETEQQVQDPPTTTILSRTPGHVAYNEFDIPNIFIEISFIRKIPQGSGCTLIPDNNAIQNNFYKLKDIKYILEQSLTKTRATISMNDTIITWYRGIQYNLFVSSILPNTIYTSISCINTDIEIEFGSNSSSTPNTSSTSTSTSTDDSSNNKLSTIHDDDDDKMTISKPSSTSSGGYTLGSDRTSSNNTSTSTSTSDDTGSSTNNKQLGTNVATSGTSTTILIPEPSIEQKDNIVTIQLRSSTSTIQIIGSSSNSNRRRFDITVATLSDLFAYALSIISLSSDNNTNTTTTSTNFQLVTRFPRRIFTLSDNTTNNNTLLIDVGIQAGQELLFIESIE